VVEFGSHAHRFRVALSRPCRQLGCKPSGIAMGWSTCAHVQRRVKGGGGGRGGVLCVCMRACVRSVCLCVCLCVCARAREFVSRCSLGVVRFGRDGLYSQTRCCPCVEAAVRAA
jgi:hypothetical protein